MITIGGNIGCGKSTVIKELNEHLRHRCVVVPEPIHEWGSWIDLFYTNPSKYAFGFQMKILNSFLKCVRRHTNPSIPLITERSPIDSLEVFSKVLYEDKTMNHLEYNLYKAYVEEVGWVPNVYIYLRATPDVCIRRIQQRARGCESGMDEDYIRKLDAYYEKLTIADPKSFHVVDASRDKNEVFQDVYQLVLNALSAD